MLKNKKKILLILSTMILAIASVYPIEALNDIVTNKEEVELITMDRSVNPNDITINDSLYEINNINLDGQEIDKDKGIIIDLLPDGEHTISLTYNKSGDDQKSEESKVFYISRIKQTLRLAEDEIEFEYESQYLDSKDLVLKLELLEDNGQKSIIYKGEFLNRYKLKDITKEIEIKDSSITIQSTVVDSMNENYSSVETISLELMHDQHNQEIKDRPNHIPKMTTDGVPAFIENDWVFDKRIQIIGLSQII